jgi:hypothetical protein
VILDDCTCHAGDFFLDESTYTGSVPLFLPVYSSEQTQPLNLDIFHIEKDEAPRAKPSSLLHKQTRQSIKALNGSQKACWPNNVTSAFRLYWDTGHQAVVTGVDKSIAASPRH